MDYLHNLGNIIGTYDRGLTISRYVRNRNLIIGDDIKVHVTDDSHDRHGVRNAVNNIEYRRSRYYRDEFLLPG